MTTATLAALLLLAPQDGVTPKQLEGVWVGARFTEGRGEDMSKGTALIITFRGGLLAVQKKSRSLVGKARYVIGEDGTSIDATGLTGGYRGKTYLGIIKVEGDTLYWCSSGTASKNQKRPTGYAGNPGAPHYLIVAKRQPDPRRRRR